MKIFYIILGSVSLGLGVLGSFLPILPTTPFLLLTAYCYARGSQKFHDWFTGTKLYKKYLESFVLHRSMTLQSKLTILGSASLMLLFPLFLVNNIYVKMVILFLYFYKYYYFFTQIKTVRINYNKLNK